MRIVAPIPFFFKLIKKKRKENLFHVSCVTCHMSPVSCHLSPVTSQQRQNLQQQTLSMLTAPPCKNYWSTFKTFVMVDLFWNTSGYLKALELGSGVP